MTNEEAIEILASMKTDLYDSGVDENNIIFGRDIKAINLAIKVLEGRPKGEWNEIQAGMFACPFCGARPHKDFKNFCAKCGADMGGDKNGDDE